MIIRENIPKQESVKESSFLDKVVFENCNLLEGKFFDFITRNAPYNRIMRDHEDKTQAIIDKYKKQDQEREKKLSSIKYKNFTKEEVDDVIKQFDKANKVLIRWFLSIKPKMKIRDFDIDSIGFTYEYGDTDDNYNFTQYLADTRRKYDDPEENDLSDINWNYSVKWTKDPEISTEEYYKDIETMKLSIESEFKKFIKANGFKEESYAGSRMTVGYGSSKYPNIGVSYNIKDDEFGIFVDCTVDTSK